MSGTGSRHGVRDGDAQLLPKKKMLIVDCLSPVLKAPPDLSDEVDRDHAPIFS